MTPGSAAPVSVTRLRARYPFPRTFLFTLGALALLTRDNLERAGHDVTFSVDEGGRHMPSGSFQREALDWYFEQRDQH
jgi:hypothetical protein